MSSGCGTQQNDSKDEPTYAESLELQQLCPRRSQSQENDSEMLVLNADGLHATSSGAIDGNQTDMNKTNKSTGRHSIEPDSKSNVSVIKNVYSCASPLSPQISHSERTKNSQSRYNLRRLASDQSINSLAIDPEDTFTTPNLRDELLNCDQKELFQFLNDDFDNSHNYFSDTVGYGSTFIDPESESLLIDSKRDNGIFSPTRKASTVSNKSNLSYISNSIFEKLENARGGSISESIDRQRKAAAIASATDSYPRCDELEPLVQDSEFENIIASFEKELNIIRNSTGSLQRQTSNVSHTSNEAKLKAHSFEKSSSTHTYEEILPMRLNNSSNSNKSNRTNSVKLKRRSLEKQMKVDDDYNVSNEIKKICDHIQAPFTDNKNTTNKNAINNETGNVNENQYTNKSSSTICASSPKTRRKNDFHSSFDRIKRTSLIERVDESLADENAEHDFVLTSMLPITKTSTNLTNTMIYTQPLTFEQSQHQSNSEKLPRKYLNAEMNIESLSLKSTGSYEHLVCHRDKEQKKIRFEKCSDDKVNSTLERSNISKRTDASNAHGEKGMNYGYYFVTKKNNEEREKIFFSYNCTYLTLYNYRIE